MKRSPLCLLLPALVLTACGDPVEPGCDPCRTTAVVYGTVRDSVGSPVADVRISILGYLAGSCDAGFRVGGDGYTDASGRFGGLLSSLYSPFTARCFKVTVNPDSTDPWPTQPFLVQDSLEFRDELHGEPRDSLRIDVNLGAD